MVGLECSCRGNLVFNCWAWVNGLTWGLGDSLIQMVCVCERLSVRVPVCLCACVNVNGCLLVEAKQPLFVSLGWTWTSFSFKSSFKHRHKHRTFFFFKWVISQPLLPWSSSLWCLFIFFMAHVLLKMIDFNNCQLKKKFRWKKIHFPEDADGMYTLFYVKEQPFNACVLSLAILSPKFLWNCNSNQ